MSSRNIIDEPLAAIDEDNPDDFTLYPHSQHKPYQGTRADAMDIMRQLDKALHPWGDPGVVPADVGLYYISGDVEEVATRTPDEWYVDGKRRSIAQMKVDATTYGYSFRARWDPEPPRG